MYKQQRQYIFFQYLFNGIFFMTEDEYHWCLYKIAPHPPQYLTIAI